MKKNYNPYTTPEGFFEASGRKAVNSYMKRVRTVKCALLSAAVVAVLIVVPVFASRQAAMQEPSMEECVANNLAQMYDYDVFLQVNL